MCVCAVMSVCKESMSISLIKRSKSTVHPLSQFDEPPTSCQCRERGSYRITGFCQARAKPRHDSGFPDTRTM